MIIFLLGEDRSYLSWTARHRNGFVLDWLRKPTRKKPKIHRATCAEIKTSNTKNTHWTTGRRIKVCSLDLDELASWANEESSSDVEFCDLCTPTDDSILHAPNRDRHLTRLGKDIVDYVVEAAVIHLDQHDFDYHLTVGEVAQCMDKSLAQISPAITRLAEDDYVRLGGQGESGAPLPADCKIFPTADALRMLPAFENISNRQVEEELEDLTEEE